MLLDNLCCFKDLFNCYLLALKKETYAFKYLKKA